MAAEAPLNDALFVPDGDRFIPTAHTRGPWDPRAQHGGAPSALLARCIEEVEAAAPMRVVRMSIDLVRPVPLAPLRVVTRVTRPGRRVQVVEATVLDGEVEVARAAALRLRDAALDLDELEPGGPTPHAGPEASRPMTGMRMPGGITAAYPLTGCELRFADGAIDARGGAVAWIRLRVPVVEGEAPSALSRVAAAADFGNGISSILDWDRRIFINPDLGIWLGRQPQGEWVCLESTTHVDAEHGAGMAESALWDERGRIGRSVQSLLVEAQRPQPAP
jgi:acyl-Coa thioesterase superfamily protein/acyl-CoA thioesterase superfamily protein